MMPTRTNGKISFLTDTTKRPAIICGIFVGACTLGSVVIAAGGGSNTQTLAIGAVVLAALSGFVVFALELPVMGVVRFAFIASFFFKGDISLFKVDEIEDPSGLNISLTFVIAVVLVIYDFLTDEDRERIFTPSFSLLLASLFVCATISVIYAGATPLGGFSLLSLFTSILIVYATASHFARRDRIIQLVVGIGIGVLFTGIIAFSQYTFEWPINLPFLGTGTEGEQSGTQSVELSRVPAFLRTPNGMGWVISCLVPLVLAPVICRVKGFTFSQRMLLFTAAFAGVVGVILSLARGSWIGLVVAVGLMVLLGWYRLSTRERGTYFVTVGGTLLLTCVLLTPFAGRIYDRLTEDDGGAASIRMPLMENALRMIEDNPFAGVGLNGYRTYMTQYDETGIFVSQEFPNPVHNVFAHVTVEIGVPGGIIFCLLILFAFAECFKTMTMHDRLLFAIALGAAAGLVAFVISGVKEPGSLGSVRAPMRTFFLLLGTIMALGGVRRGVVAERFANI